MPELDRDYWINVWREHGSSTRYEHPQLQVMRTCAGQPLSDPQVQSIEVDILKNLDLRSTHSVADLGCGNGWFSRLLAGRCRTVLACDVSRDLLSSWDSDCPSNVQRRVGDIRHLRFNEGEFDRILAYGVLQYLSLAETLTLFQTLVGSLRPNGRILLGDLPDARRMWTFFNSADRRAAYFRGLVDQSPVIGSWFDPDWIFHAAHFAGFEHVDILFQPEHLPYAHFRFDAVLGRPNSDKLS
ncbi:MAG: class I SAM-dependent methyltransferase [Planctomycetota bacterium]|nr:class I SAM-dependent methyltransferase [Planctomycetota bacterium]MDA1179490.1 class I SAM-dependent methyltransferase [Planctomycetota bacterium]